MGRNICLPHTHLIIIICVFTGLAIWYIHNEKKRHIDDPNYKYNDAILSKIAKSIAELPDKLKEQTINNESNYKYSNQIDKIAHSIAELPDKLKEQTINNESNYKYSDQMLNKIAHSIAELPDKLKEQTINNESNYKYSDQILNKIAHSIAELPDKLKEQTNYNQINISPELEKRIALTKRDQDVIINDLVPPERRMPAHIYPDKSLKQIINIPSRGYPDTYQMIGIVLRNNTETAYNLYGRQTFPGSSQYEYYVQGNMDGNIIKIPIKIRNDREVEDGQGIQIPGTDPAKGIFKVKLYNLDTPRYNPNIF